MRWLLGGLLSTWLLDYNSRNEFDESKAKLVLDYLRCRRASKSVHRSVVDSEHFILQLLILF